jgi:hypothetical protein
MGILVEIGCRISACDCHWVATRESRDCRRPAPPDAEELALMRWLDEQCLATPFYGSRMAAVLRPPDRPSGQPEAGYSG